MSKTKYTIKDFKKDFPSDSKCLKYLFNLIYGDNFVCPQCEQWGKFHQSKTRKMFACQCGYQVNPAAGTIFHKSSTKLTLWFYAIFIMSQAKNGVSSAELQRQLGVTYKCAHRMNRQIRKLMLEKPEMLKGIVEVDETYYGPKTPGKVGLTNKTPIMGFVERGGKVVARQVKTVSASIAHENVNQYVQKGSKLITDKHRAYINVKGYDHHSLNHSKKEYVRGNYHVNTIEGFWSHVKRSIKGTYISVSKQHLQSYMDQFTFHYSNRDNEKHPFNLLIERI